ncbi:hypothetical protein Tco_0592261, partial [Tanacetum coccineum]
VEDQPLPADALPTALSPGYVADLDLEEDPEEDPVNYPDDDDEEEKEEEDSSDDKEEEEHLALTDSALHVPDSVPSSEETEPFETDESA